MKKIRLNNKDNNVNVQRDSDRKRDPLSLTDFTNSLKMKPNQNVIGGTEQLPVSVFGREMNKVRNEDDKSNAMKTDFVKMYSYAELGEKLRRLRPDEAEVKGDGWFSLEELNDRLMKLRELEEKETQAAVNGISFRDLRDSLVKLKTVDEDKARKTSGELAVYAGFR